jgi:hypothetical protein
VAPVNRWARSLLALSAVIALAPAARADDRESLFRPVSPARRNGLVLGASGGVALAGASGTPNGARFLDDPAYYSSSPLLVGWSSSYFLMGALTDYLSFGPMVTIAELESPRWKSTGWGAGFRGEVFPLVKLVPALADAAVYAQLGFGATELRAKGPYPTADGAQSFLGVGLHHEWRLGRALGGHAAAGPYVEYDAIRSPSAERHWATAGLRLVWYGGGVSADR